MSTVNYKKLIGDLALAIFLASSTGCETTHDERSEGRRKDDKEITESIKKKLDNETVYKFDGVSVNTFGGVVQLSGFVNTEPQKLRAQEIAEHTDGVEQVINGLATKQFAPTPTGRAGNTSAPRVYAAPPVQPAPQGGTNQSEQGVSPK
jgi:hypothetical protein